MKGVLCALVLAFLIAVVKADADTCLAKPAVVGYGGNCGASLACQHGSFCNEEGVCTAYIGVGSSCYSAIQLRYPCFPGASCQGSNAFPDTLTCIQNTFPGAGCANNDQSSLPQCGQGLTCDSGRCVGGHVGDACYQDSDCLSDSCVSLRCAPIADGKNCSDYSTFNAQYECTPGLSYCDPPSVAGQNGTCKTRKTSGSCDPSIHNECKLGYSCLRTSITNTTLYGCIQLGTIKAGEPCFDDGQSCESGRCVNYGSESYCAASRVQYCQDDGQCSYDEDCACSGQYYYGGNWATCQYTPCPAAKNDLRSCFDSQCGGNVTNPTFYNGSCTYLNCYNQYLKDYYTCSSASGLSTSLLLVSVMALVVSFFSKRF